MQHCEFQGSSVKNKQACSSSFIDCKEGEEAGAKAKCNFVNQKCSKPSINMTSYPTNARYSAKKCIKRDNAQPKAVDKMVPSLLRF